MQRLIKIGFIKAGQWHLDSDKIFFNLSELADKNNVLYSFISDGQVMYIGKTTQKLNKRMYGYQNPGHSQITNIRNNKNILELLQSGKNVEIYALPDSGLQYYGEFHINLAAGLEDSLVSEINPDWNYTGKNSVNNNRGKTEKQLLRKALYEKSIAEGPKITGQKGNIYKLKLHKTYYDQGFFNVPVDFERYVGGDGEQVEIYTEGSTEPIIGKINRTANNNGTPRIMGYQKLKRWIMSNTEMGDHILVEFVNPNRLKLVPSFDK